MPIGKQVTAFFATAALAAGLGATGATVWDKHAQRQHWRETVSSVLKPEIVEQLSTNTAGYEYGDPNGHEALPPSSKADDCVIDSLTNAVADYISPNPAGLVSRAYLAMQRSDRVALNRALGEIRSTFEKSSSSCLAKARTPAEREHADAIRRKAFQAIGF